MIGRPDIVRWIGSLSALVLALAFLPAGFSQGQGQSPVSASVEPAQVTVGDSIQYKVTVHVTGSGQPEVAVPVMDPDSGLSSPTPSGTQTSVNTYIAGGQFRSVQSIIYNYSIRTSKVGEFNIPSATVTLNGRTYDTQPVKVTVRALPEAKNIPTELEGLVVAPQVHANTEMQRRLTGVIFILPVISKTEPYNGEQVRISYHLVIEPKGLAEAGLRPQTNLDNIRIPQMSDFIADELYPFPQDLKFQEREIGGQLYLVAPIYEAVVASTKSGELTIEPFQISMLFTLRNQSGRSRSPFDDPFFSSLSPLSAMASNAINVIAQSPVLTLNVKPVPTANMPADFAGAVGEFSIRSEVDTKQVRAYDDTMKLTVVVEGEGNTESLSPPKLPELPAFTVLGDPDVESSGRKDGDRYISSKRFTYTLRPTQPGKQTIPPIVMSTFDADGEKFTTVESEPIPVNIAPGSRPAPTPAPATADSSELENEPSPEADLRYISLQILSAPGAGLANFSGRVFAALFLLPIMLLAGGTAISWQQKNSGNRKVDMRKVATASSSHHLKEAHRAYNSGDIQKMYADLSEGIRLYFAGKFGISHAEVTVPEIEERLRRNRAPEEVMDRVIRILESCDSARYAPVTPSPNDAKASLHEAELVVKDVEAYV